MFLPAVLLSKDSPCVMERIVKNRLNHRSKRANITQSTSLTSDRNEARLITLLQLKHSNIELSVDRNQHTTLVTFDAVWHSGLI